ncbi:MAG: hydrogenase 3 maturation endopeptidase HyCI [Chitinivibrionales bacterium]|nr:hydrogenase 3 maturation endopeptidase HyCI [Chitinivibrionales bacterium]
MNSLQEKLKDICKGKTVFVGIGNRLKGDDGVGPVLIDTIKDTIDAVCIDAGIAPENYLEKIIRQGPQTIILIDATDFKGEPGEIKVFNSSDIGGETLSTHALSLSMFCEYVKARIPECTIFLIGIQPESCVLGKDLSKTVSESVSALARELLNIPIVTSKVAP